MLQTDQTHKKYLNSSVLAPLLMILNAWRPGPQILPQNTHGVVAFNNSSVAQAPNSTDSNFKCEALGAVTQSANAFSHDFLTLISEGTKGNLVCLPVSVWMILAMATFGARGYTEVKMREALALHENNKVSSWGFQGLIDKFESYRSGEMHIANKIFIDNGITPKAEFHEVMSTSFRSKVQNVDFRHPKAATTAINKWCIDHTNNRIKNLFEPGNLTSNESIVLVNAVYFKGQWKSRFNAKDTQLKPFCLNSMKTVNVPMMLSRGNYRVGSLSDIKAKFVEIPYQSAGDDDVLSMFIVMPSDIDGLPELEKNLVGVTIETFFHAELRPTELSLPKFKIESDLSLDKVLRAMNLDYMYHTASNFTGIMDNPSISISRVVQKAFIEVSEGGTEVAAGTTFYPEVAFIADHPFLGFIVAPRQNNSFILFSFRYTGPPT